MTEGPYWPLAIKSLEKKICKQLSERDFIFNTVRAFHQEDICNLTNDFLVEIDGMDLNRRIIARYSTPLYENQNIDKIVTDICNNIIDKHPNRVRYRKYKVYCQHCGAPIQPNEPNCPYCGQPYVEFNFKEEI